jgi:hypothetical protein
MAGYKMRLAASRNTADMSALGHSLPIHSAPVPINVRYASESDRNIAVPRMNAIAKSGPTTPASGCISCRGYQASDFNH